MGRLAAAFACLALISCTPEPTDTSLPDDEVAPSAGLGGSSAPAWSDEATANTNGTFSIGSPNAAHEVTFVHSMTSAASAELFRSSKLDEFLRGPVARGKYKLTVYPLVRDPLDITMSLLVGCAQAGERIRFLKSFAGRQKAIFDILQAYD